MILFFFKFSYTGIRISSGNQTGDPVIFFVKRRSLLDDQAVCRYMLRACLCDPPKCSLPGFLCLPRESGHQVDIQIGKSRLPRVREALPKRLERVDSAETLQFPVVGGLTPEAQPVDSRSSINGQAFRMHGSRIGFHRNFRVWFQMKGLSDRVHDLRNHLCGKKRRGSTPDIYRRNTLPYTGKTPDLAQQCLHISVLCSALSGKTEEIAVSTFFRAEWDVDI